MAAQIVPMEPVANAEVRRTERPSWSRDAIGEL